MEVHFTVDRFSIIAICCEMLGVKPAKRHAEDDPLAWEAALDDSIFLANNRYVSFREVVPENDQWSICEGTLRTDIEDELSTVSDIDPEDSDSDQDAVKKISYLNTSVLGTIGKLGKEVMEQYEKLEEVLYTLQSQASKTYKLFDSINDMVDVIQDITKDPLQSKQAKDLLDSIGIKIEPYELEKVQPEDVTEKDIVYYQTVFPKEYSKVSWRGQLATQKFGI